MSGPRAAAPAAAPPGAPSPGKAGIDRRRYRRVRRFFLRAGFHILFWDVLLNRALLRTLRRPPIRRWKRLAVEFRALAVEMGGVLIKLGQYLRTRVDVLPLEVADAFSGLQDEVPPERFEDIEALLAADFGRPVGEIFDWIDPRPLGSASLAQVHRARLSTGEDVAVKVLRPGIRTIIETDLTVLGVFIRRLKVFEKVRRAADLDWLATEFTRVTRRELDTEAEGANAERFAEDFADDPRVYVPRVYWEYRRANTLTMENVAYIPVDELAAVEAAGIDRAAVARKIANVYLRQFFRTHFVHVDPHEGNLFVRPLPYPGELAAAGVERSGFLPGEAAPYHPHRDFQLVFVDFGMMITIPPRMRAPLRQYAIGIGTRDARKIVESYIAGDLLMPGADLARIEEMTEALLNRFEGTLLGQMKGVDLDAYIRFFADEFSDLIFENPFRLPGDMLFLFRAMGILSGLIAKVDAELDLSLETVPLARELLDEEREDTVRGWLEELRGVVLSWPEAARRLDELLARALRGRLTVRAAPTPETTRQARQRQRALDRLGWLVVAGSLFVGGALWRLSDVLIAGARGVEPGPAGVALVVAAALALGWGLLRGGSS